ncbi:unnamed protein product [Spirodela intermedia]|uniref:Uncharacterized protein n=1 Tax=Spirodela intermedia TaxID=51605 RepID=A0A7I8LDH2_SPIIN|nr:unnamed protein product [Spirodela intermedia]
MTGKCRGLPLLLVVLGGLLSKKQRSLQDNKEGQPCVGILALSYANLPYHLKCCFPISACCPVSESLLTLSSLGYLHTLLLSGPVGSLQQFQTMSYQWPSNLSNVILWDTAFH